jgi:translocation protein SEC62
VQKKKTNPLLFSLLLLYCSLKPILNPTKNQFEEEFFYVWIFEGSTRTRNIYLTILVGAFLGLVLFPVWPQFAKVGVWYISMTLLLLLTGFIFFRLFLFLFLYGIGIDLWILPNFFADDLGFFDSFKPIYSLSMWNQRDIRASWPYRLVMLLTLCGFVYWVVTQPTEFDVFVAQQRQFVDELYEGTLLSDKSHKDSQQTPGAPGSKNSAVPDVETLKKELEELEKQEAVQTAKVDAIIDDVLKKEEKESITKDDDDDEHDDEDEGDTTKTTQDHVKPQTTTTTTTNSNNNNNNNANQQKQEEFADL